MRSGLCIFISGIILVCAVAHAQERLASDLDGNTTENIEAQEFICGHLDDWKEETTRAEKSATSTITEGEPRMVRGVYLLPNDRQFRQEAVDSIKSVIQYAQTFFGSQMETHGYGYKTFQFEADDEGRPVVHTVIGKDSSYYETNTDTRDNISPSMTSKNVYFIAIDHGSPHLGSFAMIGRGGTTWKNRWLR